MSAHTVFAKRRSRAVFASIAGLPLVLLAGCGLGKTAAEPDVMLGALSGKVLGGVTPIQGATVTLYATNPNATGYGQAGIVLATGTTDVNGNFTVQPTVPCPASQQTYITAAGGYQTGMPALVNTSVLEMAALGKCGILGTATGLNISELTTVAAGYALQGFLTTSLATDGSGLSVANISAPAANNSQNNAATATAPAGLVHAFANANNLVNWQTGKVVTSFNASFQGSTINGTPPLVEINTLADVLQSCVDGATGNSNCTGIFGFMTSISGNTPTNTLQAVAYLARNPYPSVAAMNLASGIISYAKPANAYQPTLTAVPTDWSMAVTYGRTGATTYAMPLGYWLALDANDSAYQGAAALTTTTPALFGVSPYGNSIPSFGSFTAGSSSRGIAADNLGYLWIDNGGAITSRFNLSTGGNAVATFTSTISSSQGIAIDKANNVWLGHGVAPTMGSTNVEELVATGTGDTATYAVNYTASAPYGPFGMTVDASQNIWVAGNVSTGTQSIVLANTGTKAAPAYTASGTAITPVLATLNTSTTPYSVVMDAAGNGWTGLTGGSAVATTGLEEVIPNAPFPLTSLVPQSFIPGTTAGDRSNTLGTGAVQMMAIDGAGTIFIPDNKTGSGIRIYTTNGGKILNPTSAIHGCYLASTSTTTCSTSGAAATYNPRQLAVDSTGSVWAGDTTAAEPGLTQLIGLAAPSYPVLAVGMPGVSPGMTTASPLP